MVLLDTNILIDVLRGEAAVARALREGRELDVEG
jgi:predicted nucleic acid-binding protein